MIRPMQSTDMPDLLALLHWMDDAPEREVFAPDARDAHELELECEASQCFVAVDEEGGVLAYGGVSPFRDGVVLEGPLGDASKLGALVARLLPLAEGQPVYAFCAQDNRPVRRALEAEGLAAMHTTDFYSAPLSKLSAAARLPEGFRVVHTLPIAEYRALFRDSEPAWAGRLNWTPEEYHDHFQRDDVRLVALRAGDRLIGFAELEYHPDDGRADLAYLAVHPAERSHGYGRLLVALAAAEAETRPELRHLRVRAHDHMSAARTLYTREGFTHCRSVVTYLLPGDEEV